jgi:hypothetical protein
MIACLKRLHASPSIHHHTRALMAKDGWEGTLWVLAGQRELIGMADTRRLNLNQALARPWPLNFDCLDAKRCPRLMRYRGP